MSDLIDTYNPPINNYNQVPTGVQVYRKVLASQPDKSVNIASIGMLLNLEGLVQSQGTSTVLSQEGIWLRRKSTPSSTWMVATISDAVLA